MHHISELVQKSTSKVKKTLQSPPPRQQKETWAAMDLAAPAWVDMDLAAEWTSIPPEWTWI